LNKVFYRLAAAEGVLSRNLAKKGSNDWSRESMKFHKSWQETLEESLKEIGLLAKLKRYDHHLTHAANAYYASGFDRALIVTLDGYGSGLAGSGGVGGGNQISTPPQREY